MIMFLFFTFWALIFCWHWVILFLAACKTLLKFWERKTTVKKCTLFSGSNWKVLSKSALAASQSLRARCASPKYRTWAKATVSKYRKWAKARDSKYRTWAKATDSNVHLCGTKPWRHSHSLQLPVQSQSFTQSASKIHHMTPTFHLITDSASLNPLGHFEVAHCKVEPASLEEGFPFVLRIPFQRDLVLQEINHLRWQKYWIAWDISPLFHFLTGVKCL